MDTADKLRLLSAGLTEWKTKLDAEPTTIKPPVNSPDPRKSRKSKPLFEDFANEGPAGDPFAGLLATPAPKSRIIKPVAPEDIVKLLPEGFSAVSDASGIVHDGETIAVMCPKKHMHKYKMRSVVTAKTVKCVTCAAGPAFSRTCREIAEEIFGAPFVFLPRDKSDTSEYRCPIYKITLICEHSASFDSFTQGADARVIKIGKCSDAKIRPTFWKLLNADSAKTTLTQGQQKRVEGLAPITKSRRATHVKNPLPTTKTSADMANFCIENCGL